MLQEIPPGFCSDFNVEYLPQIGYLVTTELMEDPKDSLNHYGLVEWAWSFNSDTQTYWKCEQCYDLDRELGDIDTFINDREVEIRQSSHLSHRTSECES